MNSSPLRIAVCLAIIIAIAISDYAQKGAQATRWREYLFLLLCVAVAVVYGILNDQITSRISWEYFYYGKELSPILGPQTPPDPAALSLQAIRIGAESSWWVGLIAGAIMLVANNPGRRGMPLPYTRLIALLVRIPAVAIVAALIFGLAGYEFLLNSLSPDFQNLAATNLWRPHRFMLVYGIHLGGYIGGALGAIYAFLTIIRERRQKPSGPPSS
jgi:hypothetical protein